MKAFGYDLNPEIIHYNSSIRSKINLIELLIEVTRFNNISKPQLTSTLSSAIEVEKIRLIIYIDKMSRIFIVEPNKIHSFFFPFTLTIEEDKFFLFFNNFQITSASCSILSAIFNDLTEIDSIEKIMEQYWEISSDFSLSSGEMEIYSQMITHLLSFESGYLRYDYDKLRQNKNMHPENHIDFNYTSGATFKFGLTESIAYQELIDILNINTRCFYITIPEKIR